MMNYVSLPKRLISLVIDYLIVNTFVIPIHWVFGIEFGNVYKIVFLISVIYHMVFLKKYQQTIGQKIIKAKVIFTKNVKNILLHYFQRSFFLSVLLVPLSFPDITVHGSVLLVLVSILIQIIPKVRERKQLLWDYGFDMAVIHN